MVYPSGGWTSSAPVRHAGSGCQDDLNSPPRPEFFRVWCANQSEWIDARARPKKIRMRPPIADMTSSRAIGHKSRKMRELTKGYDTMSHFHFTKILVVLTALVVCASIMQAQSPLTATPATVSLTFQKGTGQGSGPGTPVAVLVTAA